MDCGGQFLTGIFLQPWGKSYRGSSKSEKIF